MIENKYTEKKLLKAIENVSYEDANAIRNFIIDDLDIDTYPELPFENYKENFLEFLSHDADGYMSISVVQNFVKKNCEESFLDELAFEEVKERFEEKYQDAVTVEKAEDCLSEEKSILEQKLGNPLYYIDDISDKVDLACTYYGFDDIQKFNELTKNENMSFYKALYEVKATSYELSKEVENLINIEGYKVNDAENILRNRKHIEKKSFHR